ncbi:hypothetical protein DFAR_2860007 [Desulfarculales bacterium]
MWPEFGRGQPVDAKREPFPSLSHLIESAVVLARPPDLRLGETPPWRTNRDEDQKKRGAIFRFGVISDFLAKDYMERGERERLLRDKCAQRWQIPSSNRIRLSHSTILGWVRLYRQGGGRLESLYPMSRNERGGSRALDEDTAQTLVRLRRALPTASVTTLFSEMMRQRLTLLDVILKAPTVYRFLYQQGADGQAGRSTCWLQALRGRDAQRYLAERRHAWADVPGERQTAQDLPLRFHQRHEPPDRPCRSLLLRGPGHLSTGLAPGPAQTGPPRKLYLDNGPAFHSYHLEEIIASLGIALVHSPQRLPGR